MRILHVLAQLPKKTGSGVYFTNTVQYMEKQHENAVVYGVQDDIAIEFAEQTKQYPVEFKQGTLTFPIVGMSDEMPYESTKYSNLTQEMISNWRAAFLKQLETAKKTFEPDVIISHHCWMLSSLVLDVFDDKPVMLINHGTDIRQTNLNPELFANWVHDLNRADKVLALSQKDVAPISDIFNVDKEKIVVMGGGYNSNIFYRPKLPRETDDKINILFAGKLSHAKGVYELCKAFKVLEETYDYLQLTLIGEVSLNEKIVLWENTGHSMNFQISNTSSQLTLANQMRAADIYVLPSYYEGLGLIAIEALGCGMRVVVTEIEGLIQTLGDDINQSSAIEYVDMPKLKSIDEPYESEIGPFVERLTQGIDKQIERIKNQERIPKDIHRRILTHSWDHIMQAIETELEQLS